MVPLIHRRNSGVQPQTWLIVVAVVVPVTVTAVVVYFAIFRFRNNQYRAAATRDPYLSRKEWARRRKLSALQRIEEEEIQRHLILRKTLTSQASSRHDLEAADGPPDRSSLDEPRREGRDEQGREKRWSGWDSRYSLEKESETGEGLPLIGEHPAIKAETGHHRRSSSPTSVPLLRLAQEPEQRASLWERRLSEVHHPRTGRNLSASPVPNPLDHLHVSPHPAYAPHVSTSGQPTRDVYASHDHFPAQRIRTASTDSRRVHHRRHPSSTSSLHSRTPSSPPDVPHPSQLCISARGRSSIVSPTTLFPNLVSPPPPAALPHSASPRTGGFLPPRLEGPSMPTRTDRSALPWEPRQTMHTRTQSHDVLVNHRLRSPSPAQSPQRKPVPGRAHSSNRLSTGSLTVGAQGAAFVVPAVSPVEEALTESERTPVAPDEDTLIADAEFVNPVSLKEGTDRDVLPSQVPRSFDAENPTPPPQQRSSIAARSADPHSFSFEEGDHLKELGISVRSPAERHSELPAHVTEPSPQPPEQDTVHSDIIKQGETGTAFSFEEGDRYKELNISLRIPRQRRSEPSFLPAIPPSPQDGDTNNTDHAATEKQEEAGTAFSFEEGGHLKELGIPLRDQLPPKRRSSPPAHLNIPTPNRDRSRSLESQGQRKILDRAGLSPADAARRLRSQSIENRPAIAGIGAGPQGKWELQVSVLDQTGARLSQASSHSGERAYHSSASEPASPEHDDTFDAESPAARGVSGARGWPPRPRSGSLHLRSPSTPMTSPELDSAHLCRANFASPARERFLAETPQRPHPFSPQNAQSPVSQPPVASPPLFASPSWSGWSPRAGGHAEGGTVETEYGRDTMKQVFGAPVGGRERGRGEVAFRLSGPPDLMPTFF